MSKSKSRTYTLKDLLSESDLLSPPAKDLLPTILDSEWPPYEITPFAYRIVNWRGEHLAVVRTRERAHAYHKQSDDDPRHHAIFAIYPDESERLIQVGASILDNTDSEQFDNAWRELMQSAQIDAADIETTLKYYRDHPPK